jgi:hypothetical protein
MLSSLILSASLLLPGQCFGGVCTVPSAPMMSYYSATTYAASPPMVAYPAYSVPTYAVPAYGYPAYSVPAYGYPAYAGGSPMIQGRHVRIRVRGAGVYP